MVLKKTYATLKEAQETMNDLYPRGYDVKIEKDYSTGAFVLYAERRGRSMSSDYYEAMELAKYMKADGRTREEIRDVLQKKYAFSERYAKQITNESFAVRANRTCKYHEKTELDEAGECPKCLDEVVEYGKKRAEGKIPINSPLLRRAMVDSGQGGWFKDSRRHSVAARKGKDKLRMAYIKKKR